MTPFGPASASVALTATPTWVPTAASSATDPPYDSWLKTGALSFTSITAIASEVSVCLGDAPPSVARSVSVYADTVSRSIAATTVTLPVCASMVNRPSALPPAIE